MPEHLRVLHVIPSVSLVDGGPSRAISLTEHALTAAGVDVATVTTDDDGPGRRLQSDAQLPVANGATRFYARKWVDFYKIAPGLVTLLWRNARLYDVVHVHALFSFASVVAAFIARVRGRPYIVRPLGTLATYGVTQRRPWLKRFSLALIEGSILRHAAAVHFTSKTEWDEAAALGMPMRGVVIPLGVEKPSPGDRQVLIRDHTSLEGRRVILFLSRLDPKKNVEGLLRAVAVLNRRQTHAVLVIAGNGSAEYVAGLQELVRSLGIAEWVTWLGHVEGAQKAAAFAAADIFVLPSHSENFGIAAVEAMLAGLPCILSRGVAIAPDAATAGAALIVAPEADAIAQALAALLSDEARRSEMGACALRLSEDQYSTQTMAERLITLYKNVVDGEELHVA